jgi:hypothetical protein
MTFETDSQSARLVFLSLYRIDQCAIWNNTLMKPLPHTPNK